MVVFFIGSSYRQPSPTSGTIISVELIINSSFKLQVQVKIRKTSPEELEDAVTRLEEATEKILLYSERPDGRGRRGGSRVATH
ncbi:hypothetical protein Bca4012_022375 [Brassica carinata]